MRKSTERVRRNHGRARALKQAFLHDDGQIVVRNDLRDDQSLSDNSRDLARVSRRHAEHQCQRIEQVPEQAAQRPPPFRAEQRIQKAAGARQYQIDECDQSQHGNQQGDNSHDHARAGVGAVDDRLEEAVVSFVIGFHAQAQRLGLAAFGQENLGHDQGGRRG